jgi:AcrR family transcriptional regulator
MARPPEPDKKLDLARRAVAVLAREGLDVPIARLAEELGVKRPTFLYHFPTRGHIVETALLALLVEQAAFVLERIEAHEHPIDRLYAQLCAVHEFHHGREARILLLSQAIAASGERMSEIIAVGNQVFEAHRKAAADRIREGIRLGTVAPCDADALVSLVRAVTDGLMVQRVMTGVALAPIHRTLWEHLLAPLKLEPARASRVVDRGAPRRRAPADPRPTKSPRPRKAPRR